MSRLPIPDSNEIEEHLQSERSSGHSLASSSLQAEEAATDRDQPASPSNYAMTPSTLTPQAFDTVASTPSSGGLTNPRHLRPCMTHTPSSQSTMQAGSSVESSVLNPQNVQVTSGSLDLTKKLPPAPDAPKSPSSDGQHYNTYPSSSFSPSHSSKKPSATLPTLLFQPNRASQHPSAQPTAQHPYPSNSEIRNAPYHYNVELVDNLPRLAGPPWGTAPTGTPVKPSVMMVNDAGISAMPTQFAGLRQRDAQKEQLQSAHTQHYHSSLPSSLHHALPPSPTVSITPAHSLPPHLAMSRDAGHSSYAHHHHQRLSDALKAGLSPTAATHESALSLTITTTSCSAATTKTNATSSSLGLSSIGSGRSSAYGMAM